MGWRWLPAASPERGLGQHLPAIHANRIPLCMFLGQAALPPLDLLAPLVASHPRAPGPAGRQRKSLLQSEYKYKELYPIAGLVLVSTIHLPAADVPGTLEERVAAVESASHFQDASAEVYQQAEEGTNELRTRVGGSGGGVRCEGAG